MQTTTTPTNTVADKEELKQILQGVYARLGIAYDKTATAQQARELMLKDGVRPEDNSLSCAIVAARNE
ncbi:MAG: hypothetical protein SFU56_06865 [Capsulimonadales bacterium]|nr:hypothetical protein [Capsulimonadales bacterium]